MTGLFVENGDAV